MNGWNSTHTLRRLSTDKHGDMLRPTKHLKLVHPPSHVAGSPLVRLVRVVPAVVRIVALLAALQIRERTNKKKRWNVSAAPQRANTTTAHHIPCNTRHPRGFSAAPGALRTRPDREGGLRGSCPPLRGRSPRTCRSPVGADRGRARTAARVARMPWAEGSQASGCGDKTKVRDTRVHTRGAGGVTYWPRGQSGPIGQKPVRYS